ncbi:TerB family tellurite resistance protein [Parvularcula sp. LCG005]|uniref:TerB family tellurite resistance protein n=1 Tax=Parvularcula sp. LCG005 TaxID=3078805 RepID=UPI002942AC26|nr:TerB family tellurite resistance protein [Parvularcula sp. LCG005]WOI53601.1 TerB family tellurite resistance protein [Parvularcula sp. LCG005]
MMAVFTLLFVGVLILAIIREFRTRLDDKGKPAGFGQGQPRLTENLTDPAEAAAVLLVQTVAYRGHLNVAHKERVEELMQGAFGVTEEEAKGLFSFGRMAVGQLGDAEPSARRLVRPIAANCTLDEQRDLIRMMEVLSTLDGRPTGPQSQLIATVSRALRLGGMHGSVH